MADVKVSALPTVTVSGTDYVYLVDDTGGAPTSGKATVSALSSHILTGATVDVDGGTIDGAVIGGASAAAITGTTITASSGFSGNITSAGTSTFATVDINGGAIDGAIIGGAAPAAITGTTITANAGLSGALTGNVTGNLAGDVTSTGTSTFATVDINGGAIDGAVIGGATPAAITGTTVSASGGFSGDITSTGTSTFASVDINGGAIDGVTIGGVSAGAGTFTNVTATGTFTLGATAVTATAAEINLLDGVTATTAEFNYLDITTLGASQASKVVTADANGDVTLSEELKAKSYNETYASVSSSAGAATIDCEAGNVFAIALTENTTLTFSNPPASGTAYGMTIKVTQDTTARTVTWPASVDWPSATAPSLSSASGAVDVFVFYTHDGGTTWYAFTAGQGLG